MFQAVFWGAAASKLPMAAPHLLPSCPHYQSDLIFPFPVLTASLALFLAGFAASIAHESELLPTFIHHLPLLLGALETCSTLSVCPILQLNQINGA